MITLCCIMKVKICWVPKCLNKRFKSVLYSFNTSFDLCTIVKVFCSRMIALSQKQSETHSPTVFSLLKYIILFKACERWMARLSRFWIQLWCSSHKVFRGLGIWHMKVWTTHMALCILFEAENHTGLEGHESEWMITDPYP